MKGGRRQLLLSLAFGDVAPDGFCADMPCGANVVGACPELIAPGSFCQCRKCLARHLRAVALEQPDDLRWGVLRRGTDEAMDVIKLEQYGVVRLVEGEAAKGRKPLRPEVLVDTINLSLTIV